MSTATLDQRVREITIVRDKLAKRRSDERLIGRADAVARDLATIAQRSGSTRTVTA